MEEDSKEKRMVKEAKGKGGGKNGRKTNKAGKCFDVV